MFVKKVPSFANSALLCTHRLWTRLDLKFSTAQNHTPIPNRKYFKTFESLSFLQKNGLIMQNNRLGNGLHSDKI